jgi:Transcription antiterminator
VKTKPKHSLSILKINGVVRIVKFGSEVAVVNDKIIQIIKMMIEGGYTPKNESYFSKGDFVIVIDGPLKGLEGEVLNESGENRLMIRIDAIQQSISVSIDRGFLKKRLSSID